MEDEQIKSAFSFQHCSIFFVDEPLKSSMQSKIGQNLLFYMAEKCEQSDKTVGVCHTFLSGLWKDDSTVQ